jgi:hypothetical protein
MAAPSRRSREKTPTAGQFRGRSGPPERPPTLNRPGFLEALDCPRFRGGGELSRTVRFYESLPSPAATRSAGVQNPCPKSTSHTSAVIGFCDRRAHGTAARLRPHLHHRPQPHLQVTPSSAPAGTGVDGARQRCHTDRPMHSARSWTACLRRCRRPGVCRKLAGRSQPSATPTWSRSPSALCSRPNASMVEITVLTPRAARASSSSGAQRQLRRPATLNWQQHEAVRRVEAA